MKFTTRSAARRSAAAMGIALISVMMIAGCSSDGGAPTASEPASAQFDPDTEYAPGVPTMNELYESTEGEAPTSGPPLAAGKNVIFVSCAQSSPGCANPPNEMEKAAEAIGWDYQIFDGDNNVNNGWATALRQAIAASPDAIVTHGMDCVAIQQPLVEAKAAGVPVFAIQGIDCDDPSIEDGTGEPLFTQVTWLNEDAKTTGDILFQVGQLQAAYVINATQGKAKIIQTHFLSPMGEYQQQGQNDMLAKCSECEVVAVVDWTGPDSNAGGPFEQRFRTTLTQHPEANAALFNWGSTATSAGLGKAIVDAGRQDTIVSVAFEGLAPSLQLIREGGGLTADLGLSSKWMVWATVDAMNRYFNGEPAVPEGVGMRIIDADNNMPPDGENYETPVDFPSMYLESWGVN